MKYQLWYETPNGVLQKEVHENYNIASFVALNKLREVYGCVTVLMLIHPTLAQEPRPQFSVTYHFYSGNKLLGMVAPGNEDQ